MKPLKILYVNGNVMHRGGVEAYMMNYLRHINRQIIHIDFVVHGFDKAEYDDEIEKIGCNIYHIPVKSKDYFGNIKELKKIFQNSKFDIVHVQMDAMSMVVLKIAKQFRVPIRIAHSHNTNHLTNFWLKRMINDYAKSQLKKYATHYFACSIAAAKWLFGTELVERGGVVIAPNAIEVKRFQYSEIFRDKIRNEYGVQNNYVLGHVGRFDDQKNHMYLLEIIKELSDSIPNFKLLCVGDGHMRPEIEQKVTEYHLEDKVILAGVRDDVNQIYSAFDVLIMPSKFEGLPFTVIEAQASGLPCLLSDVITREVGLSDFIEFLPINVDTKIWREKIVSYKKNITVRERINAVESLIRKGYSIDQAATDLQNCYLEMYQGANTYEDIN